MRSTLAGAVSAVVVLTALSFEGFRRLAIARGITAAPSPIARSHSAPVPCLGGLALFAVVLPTLAVAAAVASTPGERAVTRWLFTACMLAVGALDDLRPLKVMPKLVAQTVICSLYLIAATPGSFEPFVFALDLAFMIVMVNAFNLVDVMDGLLVVVAGIAAVGLLGGSFLTAPMNLMEGWALLAALSVAFLFNRPPARMYLGDAGALALGFFLSSLYLTGTEDATPSVGLGHLFAFAIPLFEVTLVTAARLHRGLSPLLGSPDHFSVRLQAQAGWTSRRVLGATATVGLFLNAWCFVPAEGLPEPIGVALAATTILLLAAAFLYCWRLAPRSTAFVR